MSGLFSLFGRPKHDPSLPEPKDRYDRAVLSDIEKIGWSVIQIEPEPPRYPVRYSFSVGMYHTHQHPEIILLGLRPEIAGKIINTIGAMVVLGEKVEPDRVYTDYTTSGTVFKVVDPRYYPQYLGYACWLYRGVDFPVLQCVWPLQSGHYPWDEGYPPEGAEFQPFLGTTSA